MSNERRIRLYRDDLGQVVEIPPEFELSGEYVIVRKEGGKLIIEPTKNKTTPPVARPVENGPR